MKFLTYLFLLLIPTISIAQENNENYYKLEKDICSTKNETVSEIEVAHILLECIKSVLKNSETNVNEVGFFINEDKINTVIKEIRDSKKINITNKQDKKENIVIEEVISKLKINKTKINKKIKTEENLFAYEFKVADFIRSCNNFNLTIENIDLKKEISPLLVDCFYLITEYLEPYEEEVIIEKTKLIDFIKDLEGRIQYNTNKYNHDRELLYVYEVFNFLINTKKYEYKEYNKKDLIDHSYYFDMYSINDICKNIHSSYNENAEKISLNCFNSILKHINIIKYKENLKSEYSDSVFVEITRDSLHEIIEEIKEEAKTNKDYKNVYYQILSFIDQLRESTNYNLDEYKETDNLNKIMFVNIGSVCNKEIDLTDASYYDANALQSEILFGCYLYIKGESIKTEYGDLLSITEFKNLIIELENSRRYNATIDVNKDETNLILYVIEKMTDANFKYVE